jgi:hypothetical protein
MFLQRETRTTNRTVDVSKAHSPETKTAARPAVLEVDCGFVRAPPGDAVCVRNAGRSEIRRIPVIHASWANLRRIRGVYRNRIQCRIQVPQKAPAVTASGGSTNSYVSKEADCTTTGGAYTVPTRNSTLGQTLKRWNIFATPRLPQIALPFGCSGFAPYEKRSKPC